jgi:hypothetical protein
MSVWINGKHRIQIKPRINYRYRGVASARYYAIGWSSWEIGWGISLLFSTTARTFLPIHSIPVSQGGG